MRTWTPAPNVESRPPNAAPTPSDLSGQTASTPTVYDGLHQLLRIDTAGSEPLAVSSSRRRASSHSGRADPPAGNFQKVKTDDAILGRNRDMLAICGSCTTAWSSAPRSCHADKVSNVFRSGCAMRDIPTNPGEPSIRRRILNAANKNAGTSLQI